MDAPVEEPLAGAEPSEASWGALPEGAEEVGELFRHLSSPVRVALIDHLSRTELCVHELVERLSLPQPLVSQHLRVLRTARLVRGTRRGREVTYALADEHVAHIVRDALTHTREETAR